MCRRARALPNRRRMSAQKFAFIVFSCSRRFCLFGISSNSSFFSTYVCTCVWLCVLGVCVFFCRAAFLSSLLSAFPFNFLIHSNQHPSADLSSSSGAIQQCLLHVGQSSAVNPNDKAPRPFVNQLWIVYWMLSLGRTQHHRQESYLLLFLFDLLLLLQRTGFVSTSNSSWPGRPGWLGQGLGQPVVSVVYTANGKCFVYYSLCLPLSTSLSLSATLTLSLSFSLSLPASLSLAFRLFCEAF